MKKAILCAVLCAAGAAAQAVVVNLDVEAADHTTYSGQGGYADSGNNFWNSSADGMNNLTASDGTTATAIDVSISSSSRFSYDLPHDLMSDYTYVNNGDISVEITGLTANGFYLLYVYCNGDKASQNCTVSAGGRTGSTTGLVDGTLAEGENYVVLAVTADSSGGIAAVVSPNGSSYSALNGLQLVEIELDSSSSVINVDLNDDSLTNTFSGQGAFSDPGNNYWNNQITDADRTAYDLIASDGYTVTDVDVQVSAGNDFVDSGKTNKLLATYFYGSITAGVSGLNPDGNYTVYVYACGDKSGQGSTVTINGVSKDTTNSGDPDEYSLGVNYVVFQTTADSIGRITIYSDEKLNGFQIIEGEAAQTGYEAEEAVYSGLDAISDSEASGGLALDGFDAEGEYVEYQGVEYGNTLKIRYANGTSTTRCSVYVDGTDTGTAVFAPTGGWSTFAALSVSAAMPEGADVKLQLDADDITYNSGETCAIQDKIDIETVGELIVVDTILDLLGVLDEDNVDVKMAPGVYEIGPADKTSGLLPVPNFFKFNGDNCTYDFSNVVFKIDTAMYDDYAGAEIRIVEVNGGNNHIFGLTQKDIGSSVIGGGGVQNVTVAGDSNLVEEVSIYTRGSTPYGYGDMFGKGGSYVIAHDKHAALLINGVGCHILNCYIEHNAYGHGLFMQGSVDTLVEGCYVKGVIRTTDEVLAEAGTGSPADGVDFGTEWGWDVPPDYAFSLQEDGIRCYNYGPTGRATAGTTIKNCTVEGMRGGITIGFSNDDNSIYGSTLLGVEGNFWPGNDNSVIHCQAEAPYARVINNPYESDNDQTYEITVLRETPVYGSNSQLAHVGGSGHDITLLNSGIQPRPYCQTLQLGGLKEGLRYIEVVDGRNDYPLSNSVIVNWTDQPVVLATNSSGCTVSSFGAVSDLGSGNSGSSLSPVTVTAADNIVDRNNTIDGDDKTYWSGGTGDWLVFDLGRTRNLYTVMVKWVNGSSRSYDFEIETSDDASNWTTVYTGTSLRSGGWEEYSFHTQNARYIRLTGWGNSYDDTIQVIDFDVDLKDRFAMVKNKSAYGSYIVQNTVDGDRDTRWAAEGKGQWMQVDLLNTKTINSVSLAMYNGSSRSYAFEIGVSDHPMGPFETVYSGSSSSTDDLETYSFTPVSGRFVRITGFGSTADDWNNISEITIDTTGAVDDGFGDGLVAHWDFDEGSGSTVADSAGNGCGGTFSGGSWAAAPDGGSAAYFDGGDAAVSIPACAFDSISNQVSIAFWAYGGDSMPLENSVFQALTASDDIVMEIELPWSDSAVYWKAGNAADGYDSVSKSASGTEVSGGWNHWIFSKNASNGSLNIYLNGAPWVSYPSCTRPMYGVTQASIGSGYEGLIDDVMLYNKALNPTEAAALYAKAGYYRDWADGAGLDSSAAAQAADPDADTLNNLAEYAFGGDPLTGDSVEIFPSAVIPLEDGVWEYSFRRRVDAEARGLSYTVLITDDLTDEDSWSAEMITATEVEELDSEFERVTVTIDQGARGFIKLDLELAAN